MQSGGRVLFDVEQAPLNGTLYHEFVYSFFSAGILIVIIVACLRLHSPHSALKRPSLYVEYYSKDYGAAPFDAAYFYNNTSA